MVPCNPKILYNNFILTWNHGGLTDGEYTLACRLSGTGSAQCRRLGVPVSDGTRSKVVTLAVSGVSSRAGSDVVALPGTASKHDRHAETIAVH